MSFLDQLLAGVKNCAIAGTVISVTGAAPTINFVSGATGVYNAGTKSYDITITAGGGGTVSGVDVAGSDNAHVYVGSISGVAGAGGTVPLHISLLQFDSNQTSAGIAHAAPTVIGVTPASLILAPQPAYSGANTSGTRTPGSLVVALASPVAGGGNAGLVVSEGGTPFFRVDNGTGGTGFSGAITGMWMGPASASPTDQDWILGVDTSGNTYLDAAVLNGGSIVCRANGIVHVYAPALFLQLEATGGGGLNAAVQMACDYNASTYAIQVSAGTLGGASNRHYTSLNWLSNVEPTATNIPNGDGITFVANRRARPTTSSDGGAEIFAEDGQVWIMPGNGSNTAFELTAAVAGGGVVTGTDVAGASNSAVYVVSLSGAGGSTAAIPLRAGAYISVTHSQPIIGDGSTTFVSTNSTGGLLLNANGGKQISLQVGGVEAAHVGATALTLTAGVILAVTANNNIIGDGTHTFLSTDGSVNIIVGDNTTHGVQLWGGGADLCSLTGSGSADYIAFGLPATASTVGNIRFSASSSGTTTRIGIGNHAATLNLNVLSSDTGDNMTIGDATNGAGIAITSGNGDALQLQVNATTYLQCNASVVTFSKELNYAVTGGTATSASAGANGAVPAQVVGYLNFSVSGTPFKIPYFGV